MSKRTLYKHFETKEALFGAIIDIVLDRIAGIEPVPFDPGRPVAAQLTAALEAYIATITDARFIDLNRLMTSELLRDEALSRRTFERSEMHNEPVTGLIAAAMQAGKLRKADPAFASIQLIAMIKSFFFWPPFLIGKDLDLGKSPAQIIEDCVTMFVRHYAPIDGQDPPEG